MLPSHEIRVLRRIIGGLLQVSLGAYVVSSAARGQRVTEVAWEQAGGNRGLDLEPRESRGKDDEWTQTHMGTRMEDTTLLFSIRVPLLCAAFESPSAALQPEQRCAN